MTEGAATLARPVRPRVLAYYGGQLMLVSAIFLAVPPLVALLFADFRSAGVGAVLAISIAGLGTWLRSFPTEGDLQRNEALTLVSAAFIFLSLVMAITFIAQGVRWDDALFEAVSGITTTGLSSISHLDSRSPALLFNRAWLQWCGGLGIIVLTLALVGHQGVASRRLYSSMEHQTLPVTTRYIARRISVFYLFVTFIAVVIISLSCGDIFAGLLHSLSAVSTGGFSPYDNSLQALPGWVSRYLVILFSFIGALPVVVLVEKQLRESGRDLEVKTLIVLCCLLTVVLAFLMQKNLGLPWSEALLQGGLLSISAQSTTGFSVLPVTEVDNTAKLVLCVSMLIGGSLGSTAGGVKLLRIIILYRVVQYYFLRTAVPERTVLGLKLGSSNLSMDEAMQPLFLITLFMLCLFVSWLIFIAYGYPAVDSLFEVASALATTGLSAGISSESLPVTLKLVLCVDMLLGRVEVFALLVLLYPRTWLKRR